MKVKGTDFYPDIPIVISENKIPHPLYGCWMWDFEDNKFTCDADS